MRNIRVAIPIVVLFLAAACSSGVGGPGDKNCLNGGVRCEPGFFCNSNGVCVQSLSSDGGGPVVFDAGFNDPDSGIGGDGGEVPDSGVVEDGGDAEDAGTPDAGFPDAGVPDAGFGGDGGPECETGTSQLCGSKVGVCTYGSQLCIDQTWGACVGGVRPSPEICDGLDNDCNGLTDDRTPPCECLDGQQQTCGSSTVGACRTGMQTCIDGNWANCVGNVEPTTRQCDDMDRDCDGTPDHQQAPCVCRNGDTQPCGTDEGVCVSGSQTCVTGQWAACQNAVGPTTTAPSEATDSLCNGLDDNCDGQVDEGCGCVPPATRACGSSIGECRQGTQACQPNGTFGACTGGVDPAMRQCDGLDRDCDGTPDYQQSPCNCRNDDTRPCGSNVGVCKQGTETCVNGNWSGVCVGATEPTTTNPDEGAAGLCNGLDDNCDSRVDEGCGCVPPASQECGTDVGTCQKGSQNCQEDGTWGACQGSIEPGARICDGGDHDCDGTPDHMQAPCECKNGDARNCGTDMGVCMVGTETCVDGRFGACTGGQGPTTTSSDEAAANLCNGLDDNCNGTDDEGCGCVPPATQACGTDTGECVSGTQSCQSNGTFGACEGSVGPAPRQCDNLDRDCNGTPDYQQSPCQCLNGSTRSCGTNVGECQAGTETCVNGQWGGCVGSISPQPEICDGLDNDCDSTADNGLNAPTAVACWTDFLGNLVCSDPATTSVAPLATVQLDGRMSSDPDGQALSYSWRLASVPAGSTVTISNPTSSQPTLFAQLAGDYVICLRVTDTTSCQSGESCVTMHVVPTSRVHIQLVWDKDETDLDLHYMLNSINNFLDDGQGPVGGPSKCSQALDCSFICKIPGWGSAGSGDDPRLDIDDVDGLGPENINLDAPFNQNPYIIAVHYWCDRPGPEYAGAGRGQTTAVVRLFVDGILVRTWSKVLNVHERWHVANVAWTNGNIPPYVITDVGDVVELPIGCP